MFALRLYALFSLFTASLIAADCPFCDEKVLSTQTIFEEGEAIGLFCYNPVVEGHMLAIPKRHVEPF